MNIFYLRGGFKTKTIMNLKKLSFALLLGGALLASCSTSDYSNAKLQNEADTVSYYLGYNIGQGFQTLPAFDLNREALIKGFFEAIDSTSEISAEELNMKLQTFFMELQQKESQKALEEGRAFLEKNKSAEGVVALENGLQYQILTAGTGPKPDSTSTVKVHYHGTTPAGVVFDSSVDRGEPVTFPVNGVIEGWQQILPMMPVGSKWKVWIPTELGYGENVRSGGEIKPNMPLVFEIELLGIEPAGTPAQ